MIALCQASTGNRETRRRSSFLASDLKESGQLEQDADLVAGLYWWGRSSDLHSIDRCNTGGS